jgi:hypothetical protein
MNTPVPNVDLEIKSALKTTPRGASEAVGGLGSGRRPAWMTGGTCKETTEDYRALDIREVRRHGLIEDGQEELPGIARIEWTSSGFGAAEDWSGDGSGYALRPWFLCPRPECQKRVAILYERKDDEEPGAPRWACRTCRNLCYPVELEDRTGRSIRRLNKVRFKLNPDRTRPKRMRQTTYVRLARQYLKAHKELQEASRQRFLHGVKQAEQEKVRYDL